MVISTNTQQSIISNSEKQLPSGIPLQSSTQASNNSTQITSSSAPSADTLTITSSKSIIVQQVITQQVEIALQINSPAASTNKHDRDEHHGHHEDDDSALDNLANKVKQKIHDEKTSHSKGMPDEDSHAAAVKTVSMQVEQGFKKAETVLNKFGIMDDSAANNVEQARSLINQVIEQEVATTSVETSMVNAANATRELSSALQVTTRDGDIVTINISQSQSLEAASAVSNNSSLAYAGASSSLQLNVSIQGELSEKERESINKVVERVNEIAEKLFSGKTGAAMKKLSEFEINTQQLADMSLNMSSKISYAAVSAYTQVSRITSDTTANSTSLSQAAVVANSSSPSVSNTDSNQNVADANASEQTPPVQTLPSESVTLTGMQAVHETAEVVNEVSQSDVFENPHKEIRKLFTMIADMFSFEHHNIKDEQKHFVKELFRNIMDSFETDSETEDNNDRAEAA